jgi:hypothetical protein
VFPAGVAAVASDAAQGSVIGSPMTPMTVSFIREQPGTAVVVEGIEPTGGGLCGVATIRNGTGVAVRTIRFEAMTIRGTSAAFQVGDERTIEIPPGETSRVAVNLLPATDALSSGRTGRADVTCTLVAIRFADGSSWFRTAEIRGGRDRATAVPRNVVTFTAPIEGPVPMGFVHTQRGLAVRLRDMTSSDAAACGVATLENRANVAVSGVRFAAQAMAGGPEGSSLGTVLSTSSPMLDVDILPGATASVLANLVSLEDLRQTIRTGSPQVMCALVEVRYANGSAWTSPPATAFAPTQAEVARTLIGGPPVPGAPGCRDQEGGEYSEGAIAPIALEPGPRLARCHKGAWVEYQLPPIRPDAPG